MWPQYVMALLMGIKIVGHVAATSYKHGSTEHDVIGTFIETIIVNGLTAWVLHCGGFW